MADQPRQSRREFLVVEVALVVAVLVCGIFAVVDGRPWLIIVAGLFVAAGLALDQLIGPPAARLDSAGQFAVVAVVLLVLMVGGYVAVGSMAAPSTPGRSASPPVDAPRHGSTSASHPGSTTAPRPAASATSTPTPAQSASNPSNAVAWYVTAGADVHLRAAATTASAIVTTMPAFATPVALSCYEVGEAVFDYSPYWYRASYAGLVGYVSELWLDAGADPSRTGLPRC